MCFLLRTWYVSEAYSFLFSVVQLMCTVQYSSFYLELINFERVISAWPLGYFLFELNNREFFLFLVCRRSTVVVEFNL